MMAKNIPLILVLVITTILFACASDEKEVTTEAATTQPEPTQAATTSDAAAKSIVDIAVEDGRFGTLVTALQAADLVGTLSGEGPFTVFAPTDAAFDALPEGVVAGLLEDIPALTDVLTYHVVSGSILAEQVVKLTSATTLQGGDINIEVNGDAVMVNDANVIITDIVGSNGVIHVIDAVILPTQAATTSDAAAKSIVDIAVEDGRFGTLVTALQAADLVETLSGEGPFTVFAPTDDAFDALPEGVVAGLLEDIPALTDVLTYHVVSGSILAEQVVKLTSATTLQGGDINIEVNGDAVMVNDANVIITDIVGSNGVIHVIDAVILP